MENLAKRRLPSHLWCLCTDDLEDTAGLGVAGIWSSGVKGYLRVPEEFKQSDLVILVVLDKGLPDYAVWPIGEGSHDSVIQRTDKAT